MKKFRLLFLSLLLFTTGIAQTKNFIDQPYLEVTGSADTLVMPDEIFINIQLTEKDTRDKISLEELERRLFDTLAAIGIDVEKSLSTSDMASNFKTYLFRGKDILKSKQYVLKVPDAVTATRVFIGLENAGISNTSINRVSHSGLEAIKNSMRTKAVQNAKARATALLKPLNQTLGPVIHIADNEAYYNANQQFQSHLNEVVITGYGTRKMSQQALPQIEFKKIEVTANINVKFVLK